MRRGLGAGGRSLSCIEWGCGEALHREGPGHCTRSQKSALLVRGRLCSCLLPCSPQGRYHFCPSFLSAGSHPAP